MRETATRRSVVLVQFRHRWFKATMHRCYGFAARCAEAAMPFRQVARNDWGFAPGRSPKLKKSAKAGHSHRRRSGGVAGAEIAACFVPLWHRQNNYITFLHMPDSPLRLNPMNTRAHHRCKLVPNFPTKAASSLRAPHRILATQK